MIAKQTFSIRKASRGSVPAFILALVLVLFFATAHRAPAQDVMRIAAVVNDEVISIYDLVARIDIVIASSNLTDTPELRRQVARQLLRTLVDERLQMQEATRLGVAVSEDELDGAVQQVEQRSKLGVGGLERFISARSLDRSAVQDQIRTEIAWSKVVRRRLAAGAAVGEDEIDEALARLEANRGQPEFRVAEIFLAVESPDQEATVRRTAQNLVDQLRRGAAFEAVARQFSQSATAAVGGDIGWVVKGQLPREIDDALGRARSGQIMGPIRTFDGFHIVFLLDQRTLLGAAPSEIRLRLAQVVLDQKSDAAEQRVLLAKLRDNASDCSALLSQAKGVASPLSGDLGVLRLGDLPADLRQAVEPLEVGELSVPLPFEQGSRVLMVCERETPQAQLPEREEIRRDIGGRRIELQARRYLRDLRRSAFIDIRI